MYARFAAWKRSSASGESTSPSVGWPGTSSWACGTAVALREHRAERGDLHLPEAREVADPPAEVVRVLRLRPHPRGVATVVGHDSCGRAPARGRPSSRGSGGSRASRGTRPRASRDRARRWRLRPACRAAASSSAAPRTPRVPTPAGRARSRSRSASGSSASSWSALVVIGEVEAVRRARANHIDRTLVRRARAR